MLPNRETKIKPITDINSYEYLYNVVSKFSNNIFLIPSKYSSLHMLLAEISKNSPYKSTYAYGDLYTKFLVQFENELKLNKTLENPQELLMLKEIINIIYANPNHALERSGEMIAETIENKVHTKHSFKESATPEQQGSASSLMANMLASTFLPQTTTSMASIRDYEYKKDGKYPNEIRFGTQGQYRNAMPEASYMFKCWLKNQETSNKNEITHIYFNNLPRDRSDYAGRRETRLTKELEQLEGDHSNIAVITLPADKGFLDRKLMGQHDISMKDAYSDMFEVATGRSNEKIQDFYISEKIKKILYGKGDDGEYNKLKEQEEINKLLLMSFAKLGFKADESLSPANFQAVYFHFIKYELTKFIIEKLTPKSFNMSSQDAIDHGGASSAYYNLILSLEDPTGLAMSKEEFDRALHAAPTLVKGRGMNHHSRLVWNAVNAYINNNVHNKNINIPDWLILWRNTNQPMIMPEIKPAKPAVTTPIDADADAELEASFLDLNPNRVTSLINDIMEHYTDNIELRINTEPGAVESASSRVFDKKQAILNACNAALAYDKNDKNNLYLAYDILNKFANSPEYKNSTRFEVRENYFLKQLKEIHTEVRKSEMSKIIDKKDASVINRARINLPESADVRKHILSELKFIAHNMSNSQEGMREIASLMITPDKDIAINEKAQFNLRFVDIQEKCKLYRNKTNNKNYSPPPVDLLYRAIAEYEETLKFMVNYLQGEKHFKVKDIDNIEKLLIAQQKIEAIKELDKLMQKMDSTDSLQDKKITAYKYLIDKIKSSDVNDLLSDILRKALVQTDIKNNSYTEVNIPDAAERKMSIRDILESKRGLLASKSVALINDLLKQPDPRQFDYIRRLNNVKCTTSTAMILKTELSKDDQNKLKQTIRDKPEPKPKESLKTKPEEMPSLPSVPKKQAEREGEGEGGREPINPSRK